MKDPEAVEAVGVAGGNVEVILEDEGVVGVKWKILENLEAITLPTNDFKKNPDLLKMFSLFHEKKLVKTKFVKMRD